LGVEDLVGSKKGGGKEGPKTESTWLFSLEILAGSGKKATKRGGQKSVFEIEGEKRPTGETGKALMGKGVN